jgi:hypothetical protein
MLRGMENPHKRTIGILLRQAALPRAYGYSGCKRYSGRKARRHPRGTYESRVLVVEIVRRTSLRRCSVVAVERRWRAIQGNGASRSQNGVQGPCPPHCPVAGFLKFEQFLECSGPDHDHRMSHDVQLQAAILASLQSVRAPPPRPALRAAPIAPTRFSSQFAAQPISRRSSSSPHRVHARPSSFACTLARPSSFVPVSSCRMSVACAGTVQPAAQRDITARRTSVITVPPSMPPVPRRLCSAGQQWRGRPCGRSGSTRPRGDRRSDVFEPSKPARQIVKAITAAGHGRCQRVQATGGWDNAVGGQAQRCEADACAAAIKSQVPIASLVLLPCKRAPKRTEHGLTRTGRRVTRGMPNARPVLSARAGNAQGVTQRITRLAIQGDDGWEPLDRHACLRGLWPSTDGGYVQREGGVCTSR